MIVLVPAYEPDHRLPDLVADLRAADPDLEVVVVDDGSGPAHQAVFEEVRRAGCTVLRHPVNRGKGRALKTGFRFAREHRPGEDVVCADSDGQHTPVDVLRVAVRVRAGEPLVLGARRFTGRVPARSRFGNTVTRVLFRVATGRAVLDTQTGLRGYAAALLPWLLSVPGDRFEYESNVLLGAARTGRPIGEIEIATVYLEGNASSHFRPVADSLRIYAPLLVFLLSSFTAFLVDTVALLTLHAVTGVLLVSVVGARVLSAGVNFVVNRRFVFDRGGRRRTGGAAVRYGVLVVALLALNYTVLAALTGLGLALLPAKLLTEVALVLVSYQAQRRIVFARPVPAVRADAEPVAQASGLPRSRW